MTHIFLRSFAYSLLFAVVAFFLTISPLQAHGAVISVDIITPEKNTINVALGAPSGGQNNAGTLLKHLRSNMAILPFVKLIDTNAIPGGGATGSGKGSEIDFKQFLMVGAQFLITTNWTSSSQVEIRTFEVAQGTFLFGNLYTISGSEDGIRDEVDRFCDDFLKAVIGRGGLFSSTIAFSKSAGKGKRDIWAVKANGRNLRQLTNMKGEAISPTWSPDGSRVLFTHIDLRSHALGIWNGGNNVQRVRFPGNTVIGPSYMPDGRIAVSLTDGRNPSIFLLGHSFQKERKLDESSGIDVSPSVDASGTKMAFTSSRLGGPQIFLKDLMSGSVRRVTTVGNYNTDPSISSDGTLVAFARRMDGGHRIFVHDLLTGQEQQVSFGPGSDEEPAFAPDSYFIAFMSTRSGRKQVYLTTRYGGDAVLIPTGQGDAAFPAWGKGRL